MVGCVCLPNQSCDWKLINGSLIRSCTNQWKTSAGESKTWRRRFPRTVLLHPEKVKAFKTTSSSTINETSLSLAVVDADCLCKRVQTLNHSEMSLSASCESVSQKRTLSNLLGEWTNELTDKQQAMVVLTKKKYTVNMKDGWSSPVSPFRSLRL